MDREIYLGEGVWASFNPAGGGWIHLRISKRHGDPSVPGVDHTVAIDRDVWDKLREYAQQVWAPPKAGLR